MRAKLILLLLSLGVMSTVFAMDFENSQQRVRYQTLIQQYRCPVCSGQGLNDSNAPVTEAIKQVIHQQVREGHDDAEIDAYLVARFGEQIHFMPRSLGSLMLLWLIPLGVLLIGFGRLYKKNG